MSASQAMGLGLDAGGSRTRWALADAQGQTLAQGAVAGMSGLQMQSDAGRATLRATLHELAQALRVTGPVGDLGLYGGFTGLGGPAEEARMLALMHECLPLAPGRATLTHDMDIAYRAAYAPGEGYLVYAGTGSIAAFIDAQGHTRALAGVARRSVTRGPATGSHARRWPGSGAKKTAGPALTKTRPWPSVFWLPEAASTGSTAAVLCMAATVAASAHWHWWWLRPATRTYLPTRCCCARVLLWPNSLCT